mmetsp:Transcript_60164/g.188439  ORF Transcript_60164/g.188439 Transcript_60164/m.188439 type:complete len:450 (-) Transcript_60164:97-1446(-)
MAMSLVGTRASSCTLAHERAKSHYELESLDTASHTAGALPPAALPIRCMSNTGACYFVSLSLSSAPIACSATSGVFVVRLVQVQPLPKFFDDVVTWQQLQPLQVGVLHGSTVMLKGCKHNFAVGPQCVRGVLEGKPVPEHDLPHEGPVPTPSLRHMLQSAAIAPHGCKAECTVCKKRLRGVLQGKLIALQAGKDDARARAQTLRQALDGVAAAAHGEARDLFVGLARLRRVPDRHGVLLHRRAHDEAVGAQALRRKLQRRAILAHCRRDDLAVLPQLLHCALQAHAISLHGGAHVRSVGVRPGCRAAERHHPAVPDGAGCRGLAGLLLRLVVLARTRPPVRRAEGPGPAVRLLCVALAVRGRGPRAREVGVGVPVPPHGANGDARLRTAHGADGPGARRVLGQVNGVLVPRHGPAPELLRHDDVLLLRLEQQPVAVVLRRASRHRLRRR